MTRCLRCAANVTNISLIPVISAHFHDGFLDKVAYELSTYGSTLKWLRRHFSQVITSEFIPGHKNGELVDGILNQDVQALTFPDSSIDVVSSNQVFEHVPDDIKGYQECHRVLRPGGALIFSVPLYDMSSTQQAATIVNGTIAFRGAPEFHDSRIGGAQSAPVFWRHSTSDIAGRVKRSGFRSVNLMDILVTSAQQIATKIIYAVK
jgi:SAM-dependent methyltransferase